MKILEISDRGIKLSEDGEIINQGLFQNEEDIPREINELLSIYEVADEVILKIKIVLDNEIILQIKEIINKNGWLLKEPKVTGKKIKIVLLTILTIEFIFGLAIYLRNYKLDIENLNLKKEIISHKKSLKELDIKISQISLDEDEELKFKKTKIGDSLVFLSKACKKSDVNLEKIEFLENKIILNGTGKNINNIFKLKKYLLMDKKIIESKFDFIKKEGEIVYFLMELEIS
ncbi:hypothetical protein [uncultured Cetobacterium sp.]|uniref:hypothetical protein n=1 Tax=uncultured Cetobacterium sp. TaxID=527638 RepID=UPI00262FD399|nr:hypothetical protein [uncultured Cetobacterium sp.]